MIKWHYLVLVRSSPIVLVQTWRLAKHTALLYRDTERNVRILTNKAIFFPFWDFFATSLESYLPCFALHSMHTAKRLYAKQETKKVLKYLLTGYAHIWGYIITSLNLICFEVWTKESHGSTFRKEKNNFYQLYGVVYNNLEWLKSNSKFPNSQPSFTQKLNI